MNGQKAKEIRKFAVEVWKMMPESDKVTWSHLWDYHYDSQKKLTRVIREGININGFNRFYRNLKKRYSPNKELKIANFGIPYNSHVYNN